MMTLDASNKTQVWTDRLRRFTTAGLTVVQFCQQEQVSVPSFYQWRKRLTPRIETQHDGNRRSTKSTAIARRDQPVAFAEVQVQHRVTSAKALLPNGVQICLGEQPEIIAVIVDRLIHHPGQGSQSGTTEC